MAPTTAASSELDDTKGRIRQRLAEENAVDGATLDRMEVMFDLTRLATHLGRDFESTHRANGLTWAGFRILNMLWALGDLEPSKLALLTGSSRASTSSVLNSLEGGGLVARTINQANRRLVRVSLTVNGRKVLAKAIPIQAERERVWLDPLDKDELATLEDLIHRLLAKSIDENGRS